MLKFNPILSTDSYKLSHFPVYPDNVRGMCAYIEPRIRSNNLVTLFGLQMWIKKFLANPVKLEHIDEAEVFAKLHGEPFHRAGWEKIVREYGGIAPIKIDAVPEGLPLPAGLPLVAISCTDQDLWWVVSYLETSLQRGVWYPTTIASRDYDIKKSISHLYRQTGADISGVGFALHDFGARGVSSSESAEIGGAAHLVNFLGSDNIEGVRAANYYYYSDMSGFSVPATEHSIECSYGSDGENEYLRKVLDVYAKPGAIVSIVIDGYNVYRAAEALCTTFKDQIIASDAKVVFRPDSGDMLEVVPRILDMQASAFGFDVNRKGYKKIRHVGIIQGDGVDSMRIKSLLGKMAVMGYSADNVVFGSGGALLQKVDRDTMKFAQKTSAILVDKMLVGAHGGVVVKQWIPVSKNPITDPGKTSKAGRVITVRSLLTGEYSCHSLSEQLDVEYENIMRTVFENDVLLVDETLDKIRSRCVV